MGKIFLQNAVSSSGLGTYTFSSQNLGRVAADRYIVVMVASRKSGTTTTISSISVGGVSATIVKQLTNHVTNTDVSGIAIAAVPSGATGDVVVVFGATMSRCGIALYRLDNLSSATAYDSQSSSAASPTTNLNTPDHGCAIAVVTNSSINTSTWTALTKDFDAAIATGTNNYSGASRNFALGIAALAVTDTLSGSPVESTGCFASWQFNVPAEFFTVL